jgi:hypothetical protein
MRNYSLTPEKYDEHLKNAILLTAE